MLSNYTKVALRRISKQKAYALINVTSLSMGIACAVLIFTLIKYHLSFDGFHPNSERVYRIYTELHNEKVIYSTGVPSPMGEAFKASSDVAEKVARIAFFQKRLVSNSLDKKFEENIAFADPEFLDIFNFPLVGANSSSMLGEPNTALVTESVAKKYFGETDPIGQILKIDNSITVKISGVLRDMPSNTDLNSDIILPFNNLQEHSPWMVEKDWWLGFNKEMQCFIRLKPEVSADVVNSQILKAISKKHYDKKNANLFHFKLQPLSDIHFNQKLRGQAEKKNLWAFAFIGFFLILTACVNFVNLATAQALARSREVGVRKALGGQRWGLFWQFITETAVITVFAIFVALAIVYMTIPYMNRWFEVNLTLNLADRYLLAFVAGLGFLVVFFSGAYPGLLLTRFQPILALKGRVSANITGGFSVRKGLVVTQFAISQILIMGTLIITNQLRYSQQADMGFRKDAMVIFPVPDNNKSKISTLTAGFSEITGVDHMTFFDTPPASETIGSTIFQYDSRPQPEDFNISIKSADHNYIPTFKISLVAGRNLEASDTIREYLLNETAVKALGVKTAEEVIDKQVKVDGRAGTVVGVIKDFHFKSFKAEIEPLCITTRGEVYGSVGVNIEPSRMSSTLADMEKVWKATYPASIYSYRFLDEDIERFYKLDTMLLRVIQLFAGIAIFLGCLGLYGLVSFMAERKTKEIGVRKVLGASASNILWLFGGEFTKLLLIAFALATPLIWWVMDNWLDNFVYHVDISPGVFVVSVLFTLLITFLTVSFRTLKASTANPVKSLKTD